MRYLSILLCVGLCAQCVGCAYNKRHIQDGETSMKVTDLVPWGMKQDSSLNDAAIIKGDTSFALGSTVQGNDGTAAVEMMTQWTSILQLIAGAYGVGGAPRATATSTEGPWWYPDDDTMRVIIEAVIERMNETE